MGKAILAALRSSEFWALCAQGLVEVMHAPVPDEVRTVAWVYIALRVLSKVAQYIFPNPASADGAWFKNDSTPKVPPAAALVLVGLLAFGSANAQTAVPITDVATRAHVTANGGAIFMTKGTDWSGASLGGSLIYNLHPQASLFAGYDHGIPVNKVDPSLNLWWGGLNLKVHPNAAFGFGYVWFDKHTEGGLAQLVVAKKVMPRLSINGVAAHIFSRGTLDDFEYYRVYLNYHLLGKGA